MFKTSPSNSRGMGLILGHGAKTTHASRPKKPHVKIRSNIVTNSIKTLKIINKMQKATKLFMINIIYNTHLANFSTFLIFYFDYIISYLNLKTFTEHAL